MLVERAAPLTEQERADLVAYLDGELTGPRAAALEARLRQNPAARAEAESLRQTWQLLDLLPRPEPPPDFTRKTLERIAPVRPSPRRAVRWRPWALSVGWAAALAAAAATGYAGARWLPHRAAAPAGPPVDVDEALVRDLGVVENLRLYEKAGDVGFLRELANPDDPDLFGRDDLGT